MSKFLKAFSTAGFLTMTANALSAEEMPIIDEVRHNHFNACVSYALQEVLPDAVHQSELHAFRDGRSYEIFDAQTSNGGVVVSVEITGQGPQTMQVKGWEGTDEHSRASAYITMDKNNIFDFNANFIAMSSGGKSSEMLESVSERTKAVVASLRECRTPRP